MAKNRIERIAAGARRSSAIRALFPGVIADWLRAFHDLEIRRDGEQVRVGLGAHYVREAEGLFTHARVGAFAEDDGFQVGRSPNLANNGNGALVPDLAGGDRVGRAHAVHEHTFHGLRTEVLGAGLGLLVHVLLSKHTHGWLRLYLVYAAIRDLHMLLDEHPRWRSGRRKCRGLQHWRGYAYLTEFHIDRAHGGGAAGHSGKYWHFLGGLIGQVQGVGSLRDGVLHENQAGGIRRGKIADGRQRSIVARTPLGIAGGGSGAGLHDAIAIGQSLDGLVCDGSGIGRALYGRAIESTKGHAAYGGAVINYVSLLLRECAGRGH